MKRARTRTKLRTIGLRDTVGQRASRRWGFSVFGRHCCDGTESERRRKERGVAKKEKVKVRGGTRGVDKLSPATNTPPTNRSMGAEKIEAGGEALERKLDLGINQQWRVGEHQKTSAKTEHPEQWG